MGHASWTWFAAAVLVVLLCGGVVPAVHSERQRQERRLETWMIAGPPCRELAPESQAMAKTFELDGVYISRQSGH